MVLYYKLGMDNDQTIFQNPNTQPKTDEPVGMNVVPPPPPPPQEAPVVPVQPPVTPEPPVEEPLVQAEPQPPQGLPVEMKVTDKAPPNVGPPKIPGNRMPLVKKLVKIGIGIVVVLLVFSFIFSVVIPMITKNSGGKVTLTYWGLWEDSKTMQVLISDFERQNPDIKINYSKQDIKQYRERLVTRTNDGNGPDIFSFHNTWYPMLSGILLSLPTDVISNEEFNKSFYPVTQKDLVKGGAIYGIPLGIDTLQLYVNTQLFQAAGLTPPTNWNDFINDARTLTVKDKDGKIQTAGVALGTFDNVTHAPDILSLLFLQNGVSLEDMQASSDRIISALNFYTSFAIDADNVWDDTLDPSILAFSKGKAAMFFGYSWDYFIIKQYNPNLSFGVALVPQLPNQKVALASYWAQGVSAKTTHPKEAFLFMKYLALKSTQQTLYAEEAKTRAFGEPYARVDLADTLKSNPTVYPFIQDAAFALSSPFVDSTYDNGLNQSLNTYLGNAVNSILDGGSPETAVDTLIQGAGQVFQKYGQ